ncbi:DUF5677 domain-containing protein [Hyphomonadaceae bacterium BL14]|nr:DUF5677 domain-containing protein [Hyphomonadaceae bacterium BL14]
MEREIDLIKKIVADSSYFQPQHIRHEKDRAAAGLSIIFFELLKSMIAAFDAKSRWGVEIISRSCFEYYVKIINIVIKDNYWSIQRYDAEHDIKHLNKIGDKNSILTIHAENETIENFRNDRKSIIYRAEMEGAIKDFNIYKQFCSIDAEHFYRTVYWYLSNISHGNCGVVLQVWPKDDDLYEDTIKPNIFHGARLGAELIVRLQSHFGEIGICIEPYEAYLLEVGENPG